ncbi:MAG: long-chain fatty acid--CoA ligase [Alphaproteobacteria bacterium]|nr:long-chain fatty acid--CoA ligase [Alphaproteobacteria bacterium]
MGILMHDMSYPWLASYPENILWDQPIEPRSMNNVFEETVLKFGTRPAFDFLGKKWSWAQMGGQVKAFAAGLQKLGVRKGDKVGLFLPNSPTYLIAYYAALKIGAVVVNFNPLYAERELQHQIEDSETDILITFDLSITYDKAIKMLHNTRLERLIIARFADILPFPKNILFSLFKSGEIAKIEPDKRIFSFRDVASSQNIAPEPVEINPVEDLAVLQYTGGTTGVPKGAMLTHMNIYANTLQSLYWFTDVKPGEQKMLGVLPFFHVFAMTTIMNFSVMAGFEIIAMPRFDLKDTLEAISRKRPHFFPAVPAIYNAINNHTGRERYDLSSLEYCISGGAPLPVEVKKTFEAGTGCIVIEGYGLSESSPVVTANPVHGDNVAGSIGLPLPQTIVEIVDIQDKTTLLPPGERGELCIRGPQVMKGYWNKPEATAETIREGRLHTGDIAVMDERGYVFIVDRLKDMIITNGYNVYPRNVEEAIYLHPNVEECIVAGLPDTQRGEIVKAWIKLKEDRELTGQDLKTFLQDKISPMEIPKRIEFRNEPLPKTMIGKLSRKDVVAQELEKKQD